jgi:SUKH-4 immunity protein
LSSREKVVTPAEFHARFVAGVSKTPPELDLHLDEFVLFSRSLLDGFALKPQDVTLLSEVGLPRDAPPFLSFGHQQDIGSEWFPTGTFVIGTNGSGDPLCIELNGGAVVAFNHDRNMQRVFVNSSLPHFAECLCIYQEHLHAQSLSRCFETLCCADSQLLKSPSYWKQELHHVQAA